MMQRKWFAFLGLLLSSVLIIVLTQTEPALSIAPPLGLAKKTAADMGGLIGRKLTRPLVITDEKFAPPAFAGTIKDAKKDSGAVTIATKKVGGKWEEQGAGETMDTCWIVWLSSYTGDAQDRSLLAHEVYHCFQNELGPLRELPNWLVEGSRNMVLS